MKYEIQKIAGSSLLEFKKQLRNFEASNWQQIKKPDPQLPGLSIVWVTSKINYVHPHEDLGYPPSQDFAMLHVQIYFIWDVSF